MFGGAFPRAATKAIHGDGVADKIYKNTRRARRRVLQGVGRGAASSPGAGVAALCMSVVGVYIAGMCVGGWFFAVGAYAVAQRERR